jgi:hypothetical protein
MNNLNEYAFKSIDNSQNVKGLDWSIISIRITSKPIAFDYPCRFFLCREIAYINIENKVYQIGRLFVPMDSFRNILFFTKLALSRKTFGHFVTSHYGDQYQIKVIESIGPVKGSNILFSPNALVRFSKRIVEIKKFKYGFYVEEELEII